MEYLHDRSKLVKASSRMNKKIAIILFVGIVIFASGFTPLVLVNTQTPSQSYTTTTVDGVRIGYDVTMKPGTPMNAPVAILVHGFSGNRIMMRMIALALAEDGFICASLDLRGHGSSEGSMSGLMIGPGNFSNDVNAVIVTLHANGIGNTSRLVLIGHSMGGGVVLSLGAKLASVKAVIAIEAAASPSYVNTTNPENLLLVMSTGDSVINDTAIRATFYKSINNTAGNANTVYDISGNRRELFVVGGIDHLSVLYTTVVVAEVVKWATTYVLGAEQPLTISPEVIALAAYVSIAGGVIIIISALALLYDALQPKKRKLETPAKTDIRRVLALGIAAILLAGTLGSILAVIITFVLALAIPLLVTNFLIGIYLANSIIIGILALILTKRRGKGSSYSKLIKESIVTPSIKSDAIIGIAAAIAFIVLLATTLGGTITATVSSSSVRLLSLPVYALIFALIFLLYESFFKGVVRPLLADGVKRMVISVIFEVLVLLVVFAIQLVAITALLSVAMPSLGIGALILGLGVQTYLLFLVPITMAVVASELFYEKTGGWLPQIIVSALLFATLTVVLSPVIYLF
jgi:pimeloyl-ACP methyl ester carboxylesterase